MTALIKSDDTFNVSFEQIGVPSFKQSLIYTNLTENNENKNRASLQI